MPRTLPLLIIVFAISIFLPTITGGIRIPPVPPPVEILNNHSWYESGGGIWVVGEIKNNTQTIIDSVVVAVNVFDATGRLIATESGRIEQEGIWLGDKTCFVVLFYPPPQGMISYGFEGVYYKPYAILYPGLVTLNESGAYNQQARRYIVVGQVRNDGVARARYVSGVGTLYDSNGTVVRCDRSFVNSTDLEPGQTSGFQIDFLGLETFQIGSFRVQSTGRE